MAKSKYNIEKRGNLYQVRKRHKGKDYRLTFQKYPTTAEIDQGFAELFTTADVSGNRRTFEECAKEYIEVNKGSLTLNTLKEYQSSLACVSDEIKKTRVCDLTEAQLQKFISEYAQRKNRNGDPITKKTVDNKWHFISVVLSHYGRKGFDIHTAGAASNDGYFPEEKDIKKLLYQIKGTDEELPIMIAAFASLRQEEVLALTDSDVKDGMIHVTKAYVYDAFNKEWVVQPFPKNKTSIRYTPIPKELEQKIHQRFADHGNIYPYKPNTLRRHMAAAVKAAGLDHFVFHKLRAYYTCAAHYLNVPDKFIMKNGGWKTDHTLKKNYQRALADKMDEMDQRIIGHFDELIK